MWLGPSLPYPFNDQPNSTAETKEDLFGSSYVIVEVELGTKQTENNFNKRRATMSYRLAAKKVGTVRLLRWWPTSRNQEGAKEEVEWRQKLEVAGRTENLESFRTGKNLNENNLSQGRALPSTTHPYSSEQREYKEMPSPDCGSIGSTMKTGEWTKGGLPSEKLLQMTNLQSLQRRHKMVSEKMSWRR